MPKKQKLLGETGVKVHLIVSKEQGITITVLAFVNAAGIWCPALVIHKSSCNAD